MKIWGMQYKAKELFNAQSRTTHAAKHNTHTGDLFTCFYVSNVCKQI